MHPCVNLGEIGTQRTGGRRVRVIGCGSLRLIVCNQLIYMGMNLLLSHETTCPNCWESITLTLDLSVPEQSYIEDCPVCCHPMAVSYATEDAELTEFNIDAA